MALNQFYQMQGEDWPSSKSSQIFSKPTTTYTDVKFCWDIYHKFTYQTSRKTEDYT